MVFPPETAINSIKMVLKYYPVLCVEGITDRDFFKSRENPNRSKVSKNVIVRACFGLENVSEIVPIIEEFLQSKSGENFNNCFGVIDWDYNWYHSRLPELTSNIHHHDTNNLESFVLFQEQIIQHFNESGASSETQFAVQCSEQIGYLRCINNELKKKWRFKEKENSKLRNELLNLFNENLKNQNLEAFRLGVLKLYKMNHEEFNNHVSKIEQSKYYSQARIVNGKDIFSFIKLCKNNNSTYANLEKRFTNEMFQTTSLSKHFTKWGISNS